MENVISPGDIPAIMIDTREGAPLDFGKHPTRRQMLRVGDYSLDGLDNLIVVERKSHADAWASVLRHRARFEREWRAMGRIVSGGGAAAVVVEATEEQFKTPPPFVDAKRQASVIGTYRWWRIKYQVPVLYVANSRFAADAVLAFFLLNHERIAALMASRERVK